MQEKQTNNLFPVFLKLENMDVLIVGGGPTGLEKLNAILMQAPRTKVRVVAKCIIKQIFDHASDHQSVTLHERAFAPKDADGADVVIIAVNDPLESARIRKIAKEKKKLVNVADQPDLCDFYMSSIVRKGHLKIAISTNGMSPTIGKRLKEMFQETLPDELDNILENMATIRKRLSGDFTRKVKRLNEITREISTSGSGI